VVKDVPAGATVVGIPGRVVGARDDKVRRREAMAQKIGFEAYGTTRDMPDPVAQAIDSLLDHLETIEQQLAELRASAGNAAPEPAQATENKDRQAQ